MADLEERAPKAADHDLRDAQHQGPRGLLQAFRGARQTRLHRPGAGSAASRGADELAASAREAGLVAEPMPDVMSALAAIAATQAGSAAARAYRGLALSRGGRCWRLTARRRCSGRHSGESRNPARTLKLAECQHWTPAFAGVTKKGNQIAALIQSDSRFFGWAPICIAIGSPFLKTISVGIERTP